MKKCLVVLFALTIFFSCILPGFASVSTQSPKPDAAVSTTEIVYHADGSYTVTTFEIVSESRATKTGKKTKTCYNANGSTAFSVTNTSTFTYTGSSATCTSTTASKSITDSAWSVATGVIRSGNTGHVRYNGTHSSGTTNSGYVSISCSNTGVLS
ncbi:MAG: hypothetical protein IJO14_00120 [Clostridia bacterium]|nr:hypothetical protein [Clostridia bacterium]